VEGQCFAGYEKYDLLWRGRKIAGAAQRRNRFGLLIQGSVQPPPGLLRAGWEQAMIETMPPHASPPAVAGRLPEEVHNLAMRLKVEKYLRDAYNRKR
jgi:lipoate-protein ligase A